MAECKAKEASLLADQSMLKSQLQATGNTQASVKQQLQGQQQAMEQMAQSKHGLQDLLIASESCVASLRQDLSQATLDLQALHKCMDGMREEYSKKIKALEDEASKSKQDLLAANSRAAAAKAQQAEAEAELAVANAIRSARLVVEEELHAPELAHETCFTQEQQAQGVEQVGERQNMHLAQQQQQQPQQAEQQQQQDNPHPQQQQWPSTPIEQARHQTQPQQPPSSVSKLAQQTQQHPPTSSAPPAGAVVSGFFSSMRQLTASPAVPSRPAVLSTTSSKKASMNKGGRGAGAAALPPTKSGAFSASSSASFASKAAQQLNNTGKQSSAPTPTPLIAATRADMTVKPNKLCPDAPAQPHASVLFALGHLHADMQPNTASLLVAAPQADTPTLPDSNDTSPPGPQLQQDQSAALQITHPSSSHPSQPPQALHSSLAHSGRQAHDTDTKPAPAAAAHPAQIMTCPLSTCPTPSSPRSVLGAIAASMNRSSVGTRSVGSGTNGSNDGHKHPGLQGVKAAAQGLMVGVPSSLAQNTQDVPNTACRDCARLPSSTDAASYIAPAATSSAAPLISITANAASTDFPVPNAFPAKAEATPVNDATTAHSTRITAMAAANTSTLIKAPPSAMTHPIPSALQCFSHVSQDSEDIPLVDSQDSPGAQARQGGTVAAATHGADGGVLRAVWQGTASKEDGAAAAGQGAPALAEELGMAAASTKEVAGQHGGVAAGQGGHVSGQGLGVTLASAKGDAGEQVVERGRLASELKAGDRVLSGQGGPGTTSKTSTRRPEGSSIEEPPAKRTKAQEITAAGAAGAAGAGGRAAGGTAAHATMEVEAGSTVVPLPLRRLTEPATDGVVSTKAAGAVVLEPSTAQPMHPTPRAAAAAVPAQATSRPGPTPALQAQHTEPTSHAANVRAAPPTELSPASERVANHHQHPQLWQDQPLRQQQHQQHVQEQDQGSKEAGKEEGKDNKGAQPVQQKAGKPKGGGLLGGIFATLDACSSEEDDE